MNWDRFCKNVFLLYLLEKAVDLRSARISSAHSPNGKDKHTNSYILLAVVFLSTLLIVVGVFVLLRRKKIYGGFYLFTAPPNPDHLRNIDPARALIDQTNGLPYDPVWEFPRKRIRLRKLTFISTYCSDE